MTEATALKFNRGDYSTLGPGSTIEYKTPEGQTLAYVDYIENGGARVTVFSPATGGERRYTERPVEKAAQIAYNHINRAGYTFPETVEDAGDVTAEADAARAEARGQLDPAAVDAGDEAAVLARVGLTAADAAPADSDPVPLTVHAPAAAPAAPAATGIRMSVDPAAAAAPQPGEALQRGAFGSVSEAADAVLGEPADDIVRHWVSSGGTIYQLHLRAVVPPAETADALREFVGSDARGYTRDNEGRIYLWSRHAWNVGYALVLPA